MDLRRQLTVVRRFAWLIVASVVLAGVAAYAASTAMPKTYEATTDVSVGTLSGGTASRFEQFQVQQNRAQIYARYAVSPRALDAVREKLGLDIPVEDLTDLVSAQADPDNTIITIRAEWGDPEIASQIANDVAAQIVSYAGVSGQLGDLDRFVGQQIAKLRADIEALQPQVDELAAIEAPTDAELAALQLATTRLAALRGAFVSMLGLAAGSSSSAINVIYPAVAPGEPSSPNVLLNVLAAAILALVVAIAIAFGLDYLDDTLKNPEDVEALTGLPAVGAILTMPGSQRQNPVRMLQSLLFPRSPGAERFRALRTNLEFAGLDTPLRTILVTSSLAEEGKTTVAANLAIVFAQSGRSVFLVDADLRRPRLHEFFNLANGAGLSTLLLAEDTAPLHTVAQSSEVSGLRVVTTGPIPVNPAELLASDRMRRLVERLAGEADIVVIDSPPLQAVTDAAILSTIADGTVLVVRAGRTRRATVQRGLDALGKVGAHVKGIVLNRMPVPSGDPHLSYYVESSNVAAAVAGSSASARASTTRASTTRASSRRGPPGT